MTTIRQPLHLLDRAVMFAMRKMVASMKGSVTGPEARKPFDELMEKTPAAPGVTYEVASVGCGARMGDVGTIRTIPVVLDTPELWE